MTRPSSYQYGQRVHKQRLPAMRYPLSQEIAYRRVLLRLVATLRHWVDKLFVPQIAGWAAEATEKHLPTGKIRQDAWAEELYETVQDILDHMTSPVQNTIAQLDKIFAGTMDFNYRDWQRMIRSQYGVNPLKDDPRRFERLLRDWSEDNAALITNIPNKTMEQIRERTSAALLEGDTVQTTTDAVYDIMSDRLDVTESRARLIARDQVAKLNGQFNQQRQEDVGVKGYVWRTVADERVRETHAEVDGRYFGWDKAPEETDDNHPGQDFQCRCWAEPVLPERMAFEAELKSAEELELAE